MSNKNKDDSELINTEQKKFYRTCKHSDKLRRFTYTNWCPICEADSTRRRSKSESLETPSTPPFDNRNKRLRDNNSKTPSPQKRSESENKQTYGVGDARNILETSRLLRANLCELPTTYITNCRPSPEKLELNKLNGITRLHYLSTSSQIENRTVGNSDLRIKESAYYHEAYKNLSPTKNFINRLEQFPPTPPIPPVPPTPPVSKLDQFLSTAKSLDKKRLLPTPRPRVQLPPRPKTCTPELLRSHRTKPDTQTQNPLKMTPTISPTPPPPSVDKKSCYVIECQANKKILQSPVEVAQEKVPEKFVKVKVPQVSPQIKPLPVGGKPIFSDPLPPVNPDPPELSDSPDQKRNRVRPRSDSDNSLSSPPNSLGDAAHKKPQVNTQPKKAREISPPQPQPQQQHKFRAKSAVKLASIKNRHKISVTKLRKVRNKIAHSVSSDSDGSGLSGSDYEDEVNGTPAGPGLLECPEDNGATPTSPSIISKQTEETPYTNWPLRPSLFPHVPPYVKFSSHDYDNTQTQRMPRQAHKHFKWRLSNITPIVVRKTLSNTGFRLVRNTNDWTGTWGKHIKSIVFQTLKESQKLNHFPGTFQIGRKDRLWKNLQRLMFKFGMKEFGFIPRTFVLPHDLKLLRQAWEKTGMDKWIIKPPASARGTGIRVIHRWAHLPKKKSLVVQQYIANPYLINGSKFDLRLYVLVTSFNPLRVYLYPEGLARFASTKYSDDVSTLSDRYMHLTNYSINKLSSHYAANEDANACKGHKWTLSKLWEYLEKDGVNTRSLWRSLQQLVIKTMLCGESSITQLYKQHVNSRYNCYELFGVDVLLDERLKPWLLEVNISPSLHSASPLDLHVKGPLVQSLLNLAQFHLSPKMGRFANTPPVLDSNLYTMQLTTHERLKHLHFVEFEKREEYLTDILRDLTGDDVRHLLTAEDELTVIGDFERIFPTQNTFFYFQFMEPRYYNRLFDAWEFRYEKNRLPGIKLLQNLCEKKVHLDVPPMTLKKSSDEDSTTVSTTSEVTSSSEDISKPQSPQAPHPAVQTTTTTTSTPRPRTSPIPVLVDPTIKALRNEIRYKLMNLSLGMGLSPF